MLLVRPVHSITSRARLLARLVHPIQIPTVEREYVVPQALLRLQDRVVAVYVVLVPLHRHQERLAAAIARAISSAILLELLIVQRVRLIVFPNRGRVLVLFVRKIRFQYLQQTHCLLLLVEVNVANLFPTANYRSQ